jgi:hypothetical protein
MNFVSQTKPGFDLINVLPSIILGYNELMTSTSSMVSAGTNRFVVGIISGVSQTANPIAATVHVVCIPDNLSPAAYRFLSLRTLS